MSKIDVSKIEGYADMSAEDKLAALEAYDIPEADYKGYVKKELFDKTASEAAEYKKKLNAHLSEEERNKADADEKYSKMEKELIELRTEKVVSEHKASLLSLGYSEELATDSAKALVSGDITAFFANSKKFLEEHDKTLTAEAMRNTSFPPAGGSAHTIDYNKAISDSLARGDAATAASLIRRSQEIITT